MLIELNKCGMKNLIKLNMVFDEDSTIDSFKSIIDSVFLNQFLSANEVFIDENNQITDGSQIYGLVRQLS